MACIAPSRLCMDGPSPKASLPTIPSEDSGGDTPRAAAIGFCPTTSYSGSGWRLQILKRIATLAKGLRPLLEREPLGYYWIPSPGEPSLTRFAAQQEALSILCTALQSIERSAGALAHDPTILRLVRHEVLGPEKDRASGKSLERRFIWEHTFDLWKLLGRRVGYSEGGPILRFIRIIHQALGVPEPKPSAVRQAIDISTAELVHPKRSELGVHEAPRLRQHPMPHCGTVP